MRANWIKTSLAGLALLAVTVGCTPRAFQPGIYHPDGHSDQTVNFASDGRVVFSHASGGSEVDDRDDYYCVSGNKVILSDGNYCGRDDGIYTWFFDGKALKLTALRDHEPDRKDRLTAAALLLQ